MTRGEGKIVHNDAISPGYLTIDIQNDIVTVEARVVP